MVMVVMVMMSMASVDACTAIEQIPDQNLAVIGARSEGPAPQGGPFHAVDCATVPAKLQEGLAWLANVENADHGTVLCEGSEQVSVVRGGG